MLHSAVAGDLLGMEAAVAREAHGRRVASIAQLGTDILCSLDPDGATVLRFDGARYDAEPLGFTVVDDAGLVLAPARWPSGLCHGIHPILHRPWACIRGCAEYHTYPGHNNDPWDVYRSQIRLVNLLDHVLRRIGK